jgi:hypothetical protein
MSKSKDRLYHLLPFVYRQRDAEQGYPLKALLQVIAEQVNIVEDDITQLYENWFIETCQDWAVPYIGDLVGYRPVLEAGEPGGTQAEGLKLNRILFPRREVANTIGYRRRKGTLALLEELARSTAGWPARAVEFYRLLRLAQHLNFQHLKRGQTADMRLGDALERLDGPFDELAHTVDVRRINSHRTPGRYNIPSVGLFVWRLKSYSVTRAPAYAVERDLGRFRFSVLGDNSPLFTKPVEEPEPTHIADELNVPNPIRRRAFDEHQEDYYGEGKSLCIWRGDLQHPVLAENIIAADLSDWSSYQPEDDDVAVDPELGRIALSESYSLENPDVGIWVSYHYGFCGDMGGGEYSRYLGKTSERRIYRVGPGEEFETISLALNRWDEDRKNRKKDEKKRDAIIEIEDSGAYTEKLKITLEAKEHLELRAANGKRPIIRLLDWEVNRPDSLKVESLGKDEGLRHLTLDGLLIIGRGVTVTGDLTEVKIRHCTLLPGWLPEKSQRTEEGADPSLRLIKTTASLAIESSILGPILVNADEVGTEPLSISIKDSILDAIDPEKEAIDASGCPVAFARLTILNSTVLGEVKIHAIELAENSIFYGKVTVCRRQKGCMRFCYVTQGPDESPSRTPRRYHCQPDLVEKAAEEKLHEAAEKDNRTPSPGEIKSIRRREADRVRPQFNSTRYGTPDYCQLADACAKEIKLGADDQSEMGVFHDLFQPQREANLRARLEEFTPSGTDADIIFVN